MAEDMQLRMRRVIGQLEKAETNHGEVDEMMLLEVQDGLGAMRYGQHGGSYPDPTARTVIAPEGSSNVWARDNRAEDDRKAYYEAFAEMEKQAHIFDTIRRRYMSANLDLWNRLDPNEFCRLHWFMMHREVDLHKIVPRRVVGDLCKECNQYRVDNGYAPDPTAVGVLIRTGKWPHKLYDPKERRAV